MLFSQHFYFGEQAKPILVVLSYFEDHNELATFFRFFPDAIL